MGLKPTCREVQQLSSESLDRNLSLVERARVQAHLLVCLACRNFTAQMAFLRRAMRRLAEDPDPLTGSESQPGPDGRKP